MTSETPPARSCVKRMARCPHRTDSQGPATLDRLPSTWYDTGMAKQRTKKMTDQIRQAIDDSGLTRYRIAQDTGIDESTLAKFYHGTRGLSLDNLDLLFGFLNLQIVRERKPRRKGK